MKPASGVEFDDIGFADHLPAVARRLRENTRPFRRGRGHARTILLTIWRCPNCGRKSLQYRKPSSIGKSLTTYCPHPKLGLGGCGKVRSAVFTEADIVRRYDWTGQEIPGTV